MIRSVDGYIHRSLVNKARPTTSPAPERTSADYAIEFGEYLAKAAEAYVEDSTCAVDAADSYRALKSAIYEFRKRASRAKARP